MWLELGVPGSKAMKAGLRASEPSRSEHGTLHELLSKLLVSP